MLTLLKEIILGFWNYLKFIVIVDHFEGCVILRKGRYYCSLKPGMYVKIPIFECDMKANVKPDTLEIEAVPLTTLDGKTVNIGLMIDFEVINVRKYLLENNDALSNLVDRCKGEISDYLEEVNWADIRKKTTRTKLKNNLIPHLEKMGIKLNDLKFTTKCEIVPIKLFTNHPKWEPTLSET